MSAYAEFQPETDDERVAAALAVRNARKRADAVALADELTQRERWLVEAAYYQGGKAACEAARRTIGTAATTLSADVMRMTLSRHPSLGAERLAPFDYDGVLLAIVGEVRSRERRA